jgi:thiol-disulfide isomerase/thioredoxin
MKAALALLLASCSALAQEKMDWKKDHGAALGDAKKDGRYIIVHFTGPDCPWCEKMDQETYADPDIVGYSNKTFVNVSLRKDQDKELAERYKVGPIPVTFLLSSEGERLTTLLGYLPAEEYKQTLEAALVTHRRILELEARLKAAPEDLGLLTRASDLYEELGNGRRAAEILLRTVSKAADRKAHGELLLRVFSLLNHAEGDDETNRGILDVARRMDALDADGALGLRDKAAYARAMVDFNKEDWDAIIPKLEEIAAKWPQGDRAPVALLTLGNVYHHGKLEHAKAEKALQALLEKYPTSEFADQARAMLDHIKAHSGGAKQP